MVVHSAMHIKGILKNNVAEFYGSYKKTEEKWQKIICKNANSVNHFNFFMTVCLVYIKY